MAPKSVSTGIDTDISSNLDELRVAYFDTLFVSSNFMIFLASFLSAPASLNTIGPGYTNNSFLRLCIDFSALVN